jgi:3-oxoacyl-[acyl-carrier protein] reductase
MQLEGKRVIVVGGGGGIGGGTVRSCAREGATVVVLDIDPDRARAVAEDAGRLGPGPVTWRVCDVTSKEEVDAAFADTVNRFGGLDALFTAAGNEYTKPSAELTEDELQAQLDLHVKGTMYTNQAAFRIMREPGGSIINFSSIAGISGFPLQASYSMAKGAILSWTRTVAREWAPHRIRVNVVSPAIRTPLLDYFLNESLPPAAAAELRDTFKRNIPLGGEPGDPDLDWGPVAVFLAGDGSRFITGQTLCVDGGWQMLS